jgi:hypothetical protein
MPVVKDGCENILEPEYIGRTDNLETDGCGGTVTYLYRYADCTGAFKEWNTFIRIVRVAPSLTITTLLTQSLRATAFMRFRRWPTPRKVAAPSR